jgi:hypothetical protein
MSLPIVDTLRPFVEKGDHDAVYEILRDHFIETARQCNVKEYLNYFIRVREGVLTLQGMPQAALRACLIRASDAAVIEVYRALTHHDFLCMRSELAILVHMWVPRWHSLREEE